MTAGISPGNNSHYEDWTWIMHEHCSGSTMTLWLLYLFNVQNANISKVIDKGGLRCACVYVCADFLSPSPHWCLYQTIRWKGMSMHCLKVIICMQCTPTPHTHTPIHTHAKQPYECVVQHVVRQALVTWLSGTAYCSYESLHHWNATGQEWRKEEAGGWVLGREGWGKDADRIHTDIGESGGRGGGRMGGRKWWNNCRELLVKEWLVYEAPWGDMEQNQPICKPVRLFSGCSSLSLFSHQALLTLKFWTQS